MGDATSLLAGKSTLSSGNDGKTEFTGVKLEHLIGVIISLMLMTVSLCLLGVIVCNVAIQ